MSRDKGTKDLLNKMKSAHRQQSELVPPPAGFSASVMRSIRQAEIEDAQPSPLEIFLWRMTVIPASGAAIIFLGALLTLNSLEATVIDAALSMEMI